MRRETRRPAARRGRGRPIRREIGRLRRIKRLVAAAIAACMLAGGMAGPPALELLPGATPPAAIGRAAGAEAATVVRVVDGDTLKVEVGGTEKRVRLIGVDAPESVHPDASRNCEEGVEASEHLKAALAAGAEVYLTKDVSDTDRYGRLLRYVWLAAPPAEPTEADAESSMLNAMLVQGGWAQAKEYRPDVAYSELFARLGDEAARQGLGVSRKWSDK